MRYTHTTIAMLIMMTGYTASAADTHTVFDMQLHAPFAVNECTYKMIAKHKYYNLPMNGACYQLTTDTDNVANATVQIQWSSNPKLVSGYALATVIDGQLEAISFNTLGMVSQSRDVQLLIDKYGAPTKSDHPIMQNGFGAVYQTLNAEWRFDDIVVSYISAIDSSHGLIRVQTQKAVDQMNAVLAKYEHKGPSI